MASLYFPTTNLLQQHNFFSDLGLYKRQLSTISDVVNGIFTHIVKTTCGHPVGLTYSLAAKNISAHTYNMRKERVVVKPENLPNQFRKVPSAEAFFSFIKVAFFKVTLSETGEPKLHVAIRGVGGGESLEDTFLKLKGHLEEIANPYLLKDIQEGLRKAAIEDLNLLDSGIDQLFEIGLVLPQDTLSFFREYSQSVRQRFIDRPEQGALNELRETIRAHFNELIKLKTKGLTPWPDLEAFLTLPTIKRLKNEDIKTYLRFIENGEDALLKEHVNARLRTDQLLEAIEQDLKNKNSKRLATVLAQVIKNRPKKIEGIVTLWKKAPDFFKGKILSYKIDLLSGNGKLTGEKTVQTCSYKDRVWTFNLEDGNEVAIKKLPSERSSSTKMFEIEFKNKSSFKLGSALVNGLIEARTEFYLGIKEKGTFDDGTPVDIKTGLYCLDYKVESDALRIGLKHKDSTVNYDICFFEKKKNGEYATVTVSSLPSDPLMGLFTTEKIHFEGKFTDFNELFIGSTTTEVTKYQLSSKEAEETLSFKDKKDKSSDSNQLYFEQIKGKFDAARTLLTSQKNRPFLNKLRDSFVAHQCEMVELSIGWEIEGLEGEVNAICRLSKKLNIENDPQKVLKSLVQEANNTLLVQQKGWIETSEVIRRFQEARKYSQEMVGMDMIFFNGATGSGKSSAVTHFLGGILEEVPLEMSGTGVVSLIVKEDIDVRPKIGQSLGESETIYTRAFKVVRSGNEALLQDKSLRLGDTPGFNDTRGRDMELCTNFSIDDAVESCRSIRSVVVTVPLYSFMDGKGNSIIELAETIRERFPDTFDANKEPPLYMLITMKSQVKGYKKENLEELINDLRNGALATLGRLQKELSKMNSHELHAAQKREKTWSAIQKMIEDGRVNMLDVDDDDERDQLLLKYASTTNSEMRYEKAMNRKMKILFDNFLERSTGAWVTSIFTRYLTTLPDIIKNTSINVTAFKQESKNIKEKREKREFELKALKSEKKKKTELINTLKLAIEEKPELLTNEKREELESRVKAANDENLEKTIKEHEAVSGEIVASQKSCEELSERVEVQESEIEDKKVEIEIKKKSIAHLTAQPPHEELLGECKKRAPGEKFKINLLKDGARQEAFDQIRMLTKDDYTGEMEAVVGQYSEATTRLVAVEKEYKLVPVDEQMRKEFEATGVGGNYKADIKGSRFKLDLGWKATEDGKKIIYGIELDWSGGAEDVPWFTIIHKIPSQDYHEATITTMQGSIDVLDKEVNEKIEALGGAKAILRNSQIEMENQKNKQSELLSKISSFRKAIENRELEEMARIENESLLSLEGEILKVNNFSDLDLAENKNKKRLEEAEKLLEEHKREMRDLAIIIKTEETTVRMLREFSDIVVSSGRNAREQSIDTCKKFIEEYDRNFETLVNSAKQLLEKSRGQLAKAI